MSLVLRIDEGSVRGVERTPQGGLRVDAAITRVGVLMYRDADGNEWGELRHPDDVFAADSLATLRSAPVTDRHPAEGEVNTSNWRSVAKGHVADDVRRDGEFVAATILVQDAAEVDLVLDRKRSDLSAGYFCKVIDELGSYGGVPYTRRQTKIVYNHAALLPPGAGRAGADVAIRMDGAAVMVTRTDARTETTKMLTIKLFGKEYRCDEGGIAAAVADVTAMKARLDAELSASDEKVRTYLAQIAQLVAAAQAAQAEDDAAEAAGGAPADGTPKEVDIPEEVLDARVEERENVRAVARKVIGKDFDPKGKKVGEIKRLVCEHVAPAVKLDAKDAKSLNTSFDIIAAAFSKANPGLERMRTTLDGVDETTPRGDSKTLEQVR